MFQSGSGTQNARHRRRTMAQCQWLYSAPHSPLEGGRYRVELCIDPGFPQVPVSPAFALIPCRVATASEARLCGTRCALPIRPTSRPVRLSPSHRTLGHCLPNAVSVSPNMRPRRSMPSGGLGRRRGLHPPAPVVAQRARLEALRFSVCSIPGWRPGLCWIGDPACLSAVWFAGGGLPLGSDSARFGFDFAPIRPASPERASSARPRGQAAGCAHGGLSPRRCPVNRLSLLRYRYKNAGQARLGRKYFWNIITCGCAAPNHTTPARDRPHAVSWCAGLAIPKTITASEPP